jgi:hypothetical protein
MNDTDFMFEEHSPDTAQYALLHPTHQILFLVKKAMTQMCRRHLRMYVCTYQIVLMKVRQEKMDITCLY